MSPTPTGQPVNVSQLGAIGMGIDMVNQEALLNG